MGAEAQQRARTEREDVDHRPHVHEVANQPGHDTTGPAGTDQLQHWQRTAGNQAVSGLLTGPAGFQPKLTVGAVTDPAEREADAMAAEVVRTLRDAGARPPVDGDEREV